MVVFIIFKVCKIIINYYSLFSQYFTDHFYTNYFIGEGVYSKSEAWIKKNWYLRKTNLSTSGEFIYSSPKSNYFVYSNNLSEICSKKLIIKDIYFNPDYREFIYILKVPNLNTEDYLYENLTEELLLPSLERETNNFCNNRCIMECEGCRIRETLEIIKHKN